MQWNDLFRKPIIRDTQYRMAFPRPDCVTLPLFSQYGDAKQSRRCTVQYYLQDLTVDPTVLDYTPEGIWVFDRAREARPTGQENYRLRFELQADYAMFRLYGVGE